MSNSVSKYAAERQPALGARLFAGRPAGRRVGSPRLRNPPPLSTRRDRSPLSSSATHVRSTRCAKNPPSEIHLDRPRLACSRRVYPVFEEERKKKEKEKSTCLQKNFAEILAPAVHKWDDICAVYRLTIIFFKSQKSRRRNCARFFFFFFK